MASTLTITPLRQLENIKYERKSVLFSKRPHEHNLCINAVATATNEIFTHHHQWHYSPKQALAFFIHLCPVLSPPNFSISVFGNLNIYSQ
jgi:hypothetical protein